MPGFADYERKTSRQIPVVVLEPRRTLLHLSADQMLRAATFSRQQWSERARYRGMRTRGERRGVGTARQARRQMTVTRPERRDACTNVQARS